MKAHNLKRTLLAMFVTVVSAGFASSARPDLTGAKVSDSARRKMQRPRVEMVFAIDTTGSMGGLIAGAKQKVWSIINEVAKGKPTPEIRVGLVAYRDRGDAYVTRVTQLTGDLDAVYKDLMSFSAGGGGDGPEDVNRALAASVNRIEWSGKALRALRVVFLVGDAPPHNDYQDEPSYTRTVAKAKKRGIIVNTIRCGSWAETQTHFAKIARLGGGEFLSISQTGGMLATATPYDDTLADLSGELDKTYVVAGRKADRKKASAALDSASRTAEAGGSFAAAERAVFRGRATRAAAPAPAAKADLVAAYDRDDSAALGKLSHDAELPAELAAMPLKERKGYLKAKSKQRAKVQQEMKTVAKKREAWIAKHAAASKDSFDARVTTVLREQAEASAGISYE